jgi:hypothetical protein
MMMMMMMMMMILKQRRRGGKPATNRLSYGAAPYLRVFLTVKSHL